MNQSKRVRLIISGDVQGVGVRAWVVRQSHDLALNGWVKNREDEAVEVIAEGSKEKLEKLITRCRKGPEVASVKNVKVKWGVATGEFVDFQVVY